MCPFLASQKELRYKIENMTVDVLYRNVAVPYGTYTLSATDSMGATTSVNPAWKWVFRKEKGT